MWESVNLLILVVVVVVMVKHQGLYGMSTRYKGKIVWFINYIFKNNYLQSTHQAYHSYSHPFTHQPTFTHELPIHPPILFPIHQSFHHADSTMAVPEAPVSKALYARVKELEERVMLLEGVSPELFNYYNDRHDDDNDDSFGL